MRPGWLDAPVPAPDAAAADAARARQAQLTKPAGALGELEAVAVRLAGLQGRDRPAIERPRIVVFAADHGVAAEGVSAYPQTVTAQMVGNFARGGAAISVAAETLGAGLEVVDVGVATAPGPLPGVLSRRIGPGTANFRALPAMTPPQLGAALKVGREAARRAAEDGADLLIGGEMGIGNTTAGAALACALLDRPPSELVGPGTGLDAAGVAAKTAVVADALGRHRRLVDEPLGALRCLGGFEIAALVGLYVAGAQRGVPVLVDGFIASVAALAATRLAPGAHEWLLFAHRSAEPGHAAVLEALGARPLLDLGLRLGEATGAAAALPLLRLATAWHAGMATFAEAGVSSGGRAE